MSNDVNMIELPQGIPEHLSDLPPGSPTISVLLPCFNERRTLPRQLKAIMSQLGKHDELIFLDDGSIDGTGSLVSHIRDSRIRVFKNSRPGGVCAAYNFCALHAQKDWILGCSGNDCLQPSALSLFRRVACIFPQARVAFGEILKWSALKWAWRPGFFYPEAMLPLWQKHRGHCTHGAAAFVRRDAWGKGYVSSIQWMSDWFHSLVLAARWGAIYLPWPISDVGATPHSFSASHAIPSRYNTAILAMKEEYSLSEYDDVRHILDEYGRISDWFKFRR